MNTRYPDLSGRVFGLLTVVGRVTGAPSTNRCATWLCLCECGRERPAKSDALTNGRALSCGCIARASYVLRYASKRRPEVGIWRGMIHRCHNPASKPFKWYGARGIRVCERWRNDFAAFFADMGPRPTGLTIDRINNDGNYEPGNCRWATTMQQARNTSRTRLLSFRGESMIATDWARRFGVHPHAFSDKLRSRSFADVAAEYADGLAVECCPIRETIDGQEYIYL